MTEPVNKLAEALEKSKIDSDFKRWNELPPELKLECIKTMDFKMRSGLRCTSRTEKALVDSIRYKFEEGSVSYEDFWLKGTDKKEKYDFDFMKAPEKLNPSLSYIFKNCEFEWFQKYDPSVLVDVDLDEIVDDNSIRVNNVMTKEGFQSTLKFLKKCSLNTENIVIFLDHEIEPMEQLFTIPAVLQSNDLTIVNHSCQQHQDVIELWMDSGVKMGAKLHFMLIFGCVGAVEEMFKERVIHIDESTVRMRTDNPERHVLMYYDSKSDIFPLVLVVIPSNLQKSQYSKYTDQDVPVH